MSPRTWAVLSDGAWNFNPHDILILHFEANSIRVATSYRSAQASPLPVVLSSTMSPYHFLPLFSLIKRRKYVCFFFSITYIYTMTVRMYLSLSICLSSIYKEGVELIFLCLV